MGTGLDGNLPIVRAESLLLEKERHGSRNLFLVFLLFWIGAERRPSLSFSHLRQSASSIGAWGGSVCICAGMGEVGVSDVQRRCSA